MPMSVWIAVASALLLRHPFLIGPPYRRLRRWCGMALSSPLSGYQCCGSHRFIAQGAERVAALELS